jgi:DNA polymerase V
MVVHIRTARHGLGLFYDKTAEITFSAPTANTQRLIKAAREGLDTVFQQGFQYAKAGVMLLDLIERNKQQGSLLDSITPDEQKEKDKKLMSALDAVNNRFGRGTVGKKTPGIQDKEIHHIRSFHVDICQEAGRERT